MFYHKINTLNNFILIENQSMSEKSPQQCNRGTKSPHCRAQAFRFSCCMAHMYSPTWQGGPVLMVFARLNTQMCVHHYNEGFMHCSPTVISSLWNSLDCYLWQSDHILHWRSVTGGTVLFFFLHIVPLNEHHGASSVCCQPQFPTLFTHVFLTDLNAEATLVPTETWTSWAVTEARAVHAPTMNPLLKSFPLAILIQNQN